MAILNEDASDLKRMTPTAEIKKQEMELFLAEEALATGRSYVRLSFKEKPKKDNPIWSSAGTLIFCFLAVCLMLWMAIFADLFHPVEDKAPIAATNAAPAHQEVLPCCERLPPMTDLGDEVCTGHGGTHTCCLACQAETPKDVGATEIHLDLGGGHTVSHHHHNSAPPKHSQSFLDKAPCCVVPQEGDYKTLLRCPMDEHNTCCKVC